MKKCMAAETTTCCRLAAKYNQNANEFTNSVLKRLKSFKKLTVEKNIGLIQNEVENQQEHMKLALIGKGQWRICQSIERSRNIRRGILQLDKTEKKKVSPF